MTTPIITFFNNKGGVGKTSLLYNLAWMYADQGQRVVIIDLDPQSNLTSFFLNDEQIEQIWKSKNRPNTIFRCIQPLIQDMGDIFEPELIEKEIESVSVALLAGDLALASFEDEEATRNRAFHLTSAIWRVIQNAIAAYNADLVLIDTGANLGAVNRAVMLSTNYIIMPLAIDIFSQQGLRNFGFALKRWRQWQASVSKNKEMDLKIPMGGMQPLGYVAMLHASRQKWSNKAYQRWLAQIPSVYQTEIMGETAVSPPSFDTDPNRLGTLKHYRSLMPMAEEAHKPIFYLKPADGVVGGHYYAVQNAHHDFRELAQKIEQQIADQNI